MGVEGVGASQQTETVKPKPPTIDEAVDRLMDEMAKKGFEKLTISINGNRVTFKVPAEKGELSKYLDGNFNPEVFNQNQVGRALEKATETVKTLPQQTGKDDELEIPIKRVITR